LDFLPGDPIARSLLDANLAAIAREAEIMDDLACKKYPGGAGRACTVQHCDGMLRHVGNGVDELVFRQKLSQG
jgi:hypothetical protein